MVQLHLSYLAVLTHGSYVKWSDGGKLLFCVRRWLGFWLRPTLPHDSLMYVAKKMSQTESSRRWQFLSYPINSWNLVQHEGSLSCSQHPVTCPCPEPDQSSARAHVLFKNNFDVIVSHLCLGVPVASFPQFPHQNPFSISLLPFTCYLPIPSYPPLFGHRNNVRWEVQIIKFFVLLFSPFFYYLPALRPN